MEGLFKKVKDYVTQYVTLGGGEYFKREESPN